MIYILSFILDLCFNNSLFTLLSLLLTYNKKSSKKNIIIAIILGIIYDITINKILTNSIIFLLIYFLIEKIYKNNYYKLILNTIVIIISYRIIQYIIINISSITNYDLVKNIIISLPINLIYVNFIYFIKIIHKNKFMHIIK